MSGPPDWTLREVFLFDATMRMGSLTAAAAESGLSQSSASKLMAGLEGKLRATLFDRNGRQLMPTEAAYRFHEHARNVIDAVDSAPAEKPRQHELVVAVPPTFAEGFIQSATRRFLSETADTKLVLEVRNTPMIEELVAEGRVDLGITDARVGNPNIRSISFKKSPLAAFFGKDHPLATRDRVSVADLAGQKVVKLTRRHTTRSHLDRLLMKVSPAPVASAEASTAISAIHMANALGAVAIASAFPVAGHLPARTVARPFTESLEFVSQFLLPTWQSPSTLAKSLMGAIRRTAENMESLHPSLLKTKAVERQ